MNVQDELARMRAQINEQLVAAVAQDATGGGLDRAASRASGTSEGGEVVVTVDGFGFLRDIEFRRMTGLTEQDLTECTAQAHAAALGHVRTNGVTLASAHAILDDTSRLTELDQVARAVLG